MTKVETDYYTQPIGGTDVHHIDHTLREKPFGGGRADWGEVTTHFRNVGFEKIRFYELDAISRHGVDLPHFELQTMSCWLAPPEPLLEEARLAGLDVFNGLRGIGYATRMLLPLYVTCDTMDFSHSVGCVNAPWSAVFIYERYPHGLGFTRELYDRLHEILPEVLRAVEECPCPDGCPCCVGKPLRGELTWNPERGEGGIPSKTSAIYLLRGLLAGGPLEMPDDDAATDDPVAMQFRLEHAVQRRLETQREPPITHPIEPHVETQFPDAEKSEALATPDVARRTEHRRDFARELRKRIAAKQEQVFTKPPEAIVPPGMGPRGGVNKPTDFAPLPWERRRPAPAPESKPSDEKPVPMGDSLAARAKKLKKMKDGE